MTGQRAMLFIDGQNLYHAQKSHYGGPEIDFKKFKKQVSQNHYLTQSYYFDSYQPGNRKAGFYNRLEDFGYQVDARQLVERDGKPRKKGVDVSLASELLVQAFNDNYDVAILVTGDADFKRAVHYVQEEKKRVIAAQFGSFLSDELVKHVDDCIVLDRIADEIRQK